MRRALSDVSTIEVEGNLLALSGGNTDADKSMEREARTVNKERAQHGESLQASSTSINDMSAGRHGGLHSHTGAAGRTYRQLVNEAKQHGIKGRSTMSKEQLESALRR